VPPFDFADVAMAKVAFESAVARVEADAVEGKAAIAADHEAPPATKSAVRGSNAGRRRLEL
jgi:hypothetical protein